MASSPPSSARTAASGARERHTLAETAYAVLRQRLLFQHLAQDGSGAPERRLAILGWQGSDGFLQRRAASRTSGVAGALPRRRPCDAAGQAAPQPARLAGRRAARAAGDDEFWALVDAHRCSPRRWTCASTSSRPSAKRCSEALARGRHRRRSRRRIRPGACASPASRRCTSWTCSRRGDVEVQDEGSQLLALLTDAKRGEMVVDFCAGAGGKTLALGAAMRNTGRLYAFDISGHRLAALKPRLARSGLSQRAPGADRARARRAHQAPGRQDRPRAGRRALFRAWARCAATPT